MLTNRTGAAPARLFRRVMAFLLALSAPCVTQAANIVDVAVGPSSIALRFDAPIAGASSFILDGPRRIAVDVDGALAGPASASGGAVLRTRQAQFSPTRARIVFELSIPILVAGGAVSADGRSLVLALNPVDDAGFAAATRAARRSYAGPADPADAPAAFRTTGYVVRDGDPGVSATPVSANDNGASVEVPLGPQTRVQMPKIAGSVRGNRPLVVIDAGHGGHDTGAIATAYGNRHEKDVTLAIAKAIRDELLDSGRVRVALTRSDDTFLALGERVEVARRLHADLFISIHADSSPSGESAHGATVYTLSETSSDKVAARLAAQENKSDIINGVDLGGENADVSSILIDLAQRETMNVSSAFAALLQREMSPTVAFTSNFHRFAGFRVLKAPDTPSVLLETGYLTNSTDAQFLYSKDGQRKIAEGVRRAVEAHFARRIARIEGRLAS